MHNLLVEQTLQKIAENTTKRIWNGFIKFGSVSAGLMGIYVAWRIIKTIINTILNGIALHKVYGWSIHLLAAGWTSLTQFCIFLDARSDYIPLERTSDTQMTPLRTQVNPSGAPNIDNQSERLSDDEEAPAPQKRFFSGTEKSFSRGREV